MKLISDKNARICQESIRYDLWDIESKAEIILNLREKAKKRFVIKWLFQIVAFYFFFQLLFYCAAIFMLASAIIYVFQSHDYRWFMLMGVPLFLLAIVVIIKRSINSILHFYLFIRSPEILGDYWDLFEKGINLQGTVTKIIVNELQERIIFYEYNLPSKKKATSSYKTIYAEAFQQGDIITVLYLSEEINIIL